MASGIGKQSFHRCPQSKVLHYKGAVIIKAKSLKIAEPNCIFFARAWSHLYQLIIFRMKFTFEFSICNHTMLLISHKANKKNKINKIKSFFSFRKNA